ncbi:MAG: PepSY-associated TM helix domain-containing protein [Pseudomonadota bacterium]
MSPQRLPAKRPWKQIAVRVHRWLGIGAAAIWLLQASTGVLLSFSFEIEDAALSTAHVPTDFGAIEEFMVTIETEQSGTRVNWIWTTAGLPDRFVVNYADADGVVRMVRINGVGQVLRDRRASDHSFLTLVRALHLSLLGGRAGQLLLAISGLLLLSNLILGLIAAWPRQGRWLGALRPASRGNTVTILFSWHRAAGLLGALPAMLIIITGVLIIFEHELEDVLGVHAVRLPAIVTDEPTVGIKQAANAATDAIQGSRFVGTTMPSSEDASYYAWVRAPGELYRGGYGGSLVIIDARDASIRGAYPVTETNARHAFIASFYPLHTGEAAGLFGRIFALLTGIWLVVMIIVGILLWWKRRRGRASIA